MSHRYVVHYGEIALKGKNRPDFEHQLIRNIKIQHGVQRVRRLHGRLLVEADQPVDLGNVFGIAWWAPVEQVPTDLDSIREAGRRLVQAGAPKAATFAVRVTRAEKVLGKTSQELEAWLGADLLPRHEFEVDLSNPDLVLYVEILSDMTFMYLHKHPGPRGLPVGVSGKLIGLFSGGIDSAVAAYLMAKRGAKLELLHFHALSNARRAHEAKAGKLVEALSHYVPSLTIHYVPYDLFQLATSRLNRYQRQELVVFRRFMTRVADRLADQRGALGLFTGDNLGQVASQTLENLSAVQAVTHKPIFRPLIAYDKQEIIDLGAGLGLAEIANEAYKDCCSIIARHPATRANLDHVRAIEAKIEVDRLVEEILAERVTARHDMEHPRGMLAPVTA